jgi:serine/threonine-protein kinase RsbW
MFDELGTQPCDVLLLDDSGAPGALQDTLVRIRRDWPRTAVIMMTACPRAEAVIRCVNQGATRFLIKPFPVTELLRTIAGALNDVRMDRVSDNGLTVQGGPRNWVELSAPSRQEYLDRLENLLDALYDARISRSERDDLKIALGEIVANAMEWGNKRETARKTRVSYCLFPDEIVFKVEDEGEGFRPENVPDPSSDPIDNVMRRAQEGKRVGGFGMYIARKVMDRVMYSDKGNVVVLSKNLHRSDARGSHTGDN